MASLIAVGVVLTIVTHFSRHCHIHLLQAVINVAQGSVYVKKMGQITNKLAESL